MRHVGVPGPHAACGLDAMRMDAPWVGKIVGWTVDEIVDSVGSVCYHNGNYTSGTDVDRGQCLSPPSYRELPVGARQQMSAG